MHLPPIPSFVEVWTTEGLEVVPAVECFEEDCKFQWCGSISSNHVDIDSSHGELKVSTAEGCEVIPVASFANDTIENEYALDFCESTSSDRLEAEDEKKKRRLIRKPFKKMNRCKEVEIKAQTRAAIEVRKRRESKERRAERTRQQQKESAERRATKTKAEKERIENERRERRWQNHLKQVQEAPAKKARSREARKRRKQAEREARESEERKAKAFAARANDRAQHRNVSKSQSRTRDRANDRAQRRNVAKSQSRNRDSPNDGATQIKLSFTTVPVTNKNEGNDGVFEPVPISDSGAQEEVPLDMIVCTFTDDESGRIMDRVKNTGDDLDACNDRPNGSSTDISSFEKSLESGFCEICAPILDTGSCIPDPNTVGTLLNDDIICKTLGTFTGNGTGRCNGAELECVKADQEKFDMQRDEAHPQHLDGGDNFDERDDPEADDDDSMPPLIDEESEGVDISLAPPLVPRPAEDESDDEEESEETQSLTGSSCSERSPIDCNDIDDDDSTNKRNCKGLVQLYYQPTRQYIPNCSLDWSIGELKSKIKQRIGAYPPKLSLNTKPLLDDRRFLWEYCNSDATLFGLSTEGKGGARNNQDARDEKEFTTCTENELRTVGVLPEEVSSSRAAGGQIPFGTSFTTVSQLSHPALVESAPEVVASSGAAGRSHPPPANQIPFYSSGTMPLPGGAMPNGEGGLYPFFDRLNPHDGTKSVPDAAVSSGMGGFHPVNPLVGFNESEYSILHSHCEQLYHYSQDKYRENSELQQMNKQLLGTIFALQSQIAELQGSQELLNRIETLGETLAQRELEMECVKEAAARCAAELEHEKAKQRNVVTPDSANGSSEKFFGKDGQKAILSEPWLKDHDLYKTIKELDFGRNTGERKNSSGHIRKAMNLMHCMLEGDGRDLQQLLGCIVKKYPSILDPHLAAAHERASKAANDPQLETAQAIVDSLQQLCSDYKNSGSTDVQHCLLSLVAGAKYSGAVSDSDVKKLLGVGHSRMQSANKFCDALKRSPGKPFGFPSRKPRKDRKNPMVQEFVREMVCHSDEFTRVDTNRGPRDVKVQHYEEDEEGRLVEKGEPIKESHEKRVWVDCATTDDVYKLVKESDVYKELGFSIGRSRFYEAICPCVGFPESKSAVNVHTTGVEEALKGLKKVSSAIRDIRLTCQACDTCKEYQAATKALQSLDPACKTCPAFQAAKHTNKHKIHPACERCPPYRKDQASKHPFPKCFDRLLGKHPNDVLGLSMCPRKPFPDLKLDTEEEAPRFYGWECGHGECKDCGLDKTLGLRTCPTMMQSEHPFQMLVWDDGERNGENRTQKELVPFTKTLKKGLEKTHEICEEAREHLTRDQRSKRREKVLLSTMRKDHINVYTDFSSTPDLEALLKEVCSEANHCLLDIFVIVWNPRVVTISNEDGNDIKKRIYNCTYVGIWGPTSGQGKKNDHMCHHAALNEIVAIFKEKLLADLNVKLSKVWLFTDNCSGQYKNQYTLMMTAMFAKLHPDIVLEHSYAMRYEFKGVWDAFGGRLKMLVFHGEMRGTRSSIAKEAFEYTYENMNGIREEWVKAVEHLDSKKLRTKGPKTMTECIIMYITDDMADYEETKLEHPDKHIIYCDRDKDPPTVGGKKAAGITKLHCVRGFSKFQEPKFVLELSENGCPCLNCTNDATRKQCKYKKERVVRRTQVVDVSHDPALKAQRYVIKKLKWVANQFTVKNLEKELRERNLPVPEQNPKQKRIRPVLVPLCLALLEGNATTEREKTLQSELRAMSQGSQQGGRGAQSHDLDEESITEDSREGLEETELAQVPTRRSNRSRRPTEKAVESREQDEASVLSEDEVFVLYDSDDDNDDDDECGFAIDEELQTLYEQEIMMDGGSIRALVDEAPDRWLSDDLLRKLDLDDLDYRTLQVNCKARGVKANQKTSKLIEGLYEKLEVSFEDDGLDEDEE